MDWLTAALGAAKEFFAALAKIDTWERIFLRSKRNKKAKDIEGQINDAKDNSNARDWTDFMQR